MHDEDTIAAVATPPGCSARAIVRISGRDAHATIERIIEGPPPARGCGAARLRLAGGLSLPVGVIRYDAPRSYTGEDSIEILLPANPHLVRRVLDAVVALPGVREAEPGEFSARAYLNARLSLEEAEGVAMTIAAETEAELCGARALLDGSAGRRYLAWAGEMTELLALVEAGIDFTDQEDVVAIDPPTLRARIDAVLEEMNGHLATSRGAENPSQLPLVALYGKPNAGKSTLFNALLGRRRAVEAPLAGTTRDVLIEELDLAPEVPGLRVLLADAPGADDAPLARADQAAQERLRELLGRASLVLWCDPQGRFECEVPPSCARLRRVRTKADLPRMETPGGTDVSVCALDGRGIAALRRVIARTAWGSHSEGGMFPALPARHRRGLEACREHLLAACAQSEAELAADALRAALGAIGGLTGRVEADDVIGRIFASFCVGK